MHTGYGKTDVLPNTMETPILLCSQWSGVLPFWGPGPTKPATVLTPSGSVPEKDQTEICMLMALSSYHTTVHVAM